MEKKILDASLILYARKGYAGTSVSNIVKAAGISRGLMYHYFKNKEDVFIKLVKNAVSNSEGLLRMVKVSEESPEEKIRLLTSILFRNVLSKDSNLYPFMIILQTFISEDVPARARDIVNRSDSSLNFTAELFKQIKNKSTAEFDPDEQSVLYWSLIHGIVFLRLSQPNILQLPAEESLLSMFGL